MSIAGYRGTSGRTGELAYGDTPALNAELSAVQADVRHFVSHPNVVSWLEPHGELAQGRRRLDGLRSPPATARSAIISSSITPRPTMSARPGPASPARSRRGDAIHCPELVEFCGWGPDALNLAGTWKDNPFTGAASPDWFTPTFKRLRLADRHRAGRRPQLHAAEAARRLSPQLRPARRLDGEASALVDLSLGHQHSAHRSGRGDLGQRQESRRKRPSRRHRSTG